MNHPTTSTGKDDSIALSAPELRHSNASDPPNVKFVIVRHRRLNREANQPIKPTGQGNPDGGG